VTRQGDKGSSPLEEEIRRRILHDGPISVADYMALALGHPRYGYYMAREPFGRGGDFVTAPEVSQMFGELLGLWTADTWTRLGAPSLVRFIELGPGRGTLMADALRALRLAPDFLESATLHLVETSPRLRAIQQTSLAAAPLRPDWHNRLEETPDGPAIVLANEFFDALPIRQLVRMDGGWRERVVGLIDDRLTFGLSPSPLPAATVPDAFAAAPPGVVCEISPARLAVAEAIGRRVASSGGAAIVIDYGHFPSTPGETLQAVRGHAPVHPLAGPGQSDLTAHVDFNALANAARAGGAAVFGPTGQGDFLRALGIETRAASLKARASPEQAIAVDAALRRLVAADAMGMLFKAVAIASPGLVPSPFDSLGEPGDRRAVAGAP
jgi:NADH dehydrogenase [ubiquinone] 1 alpha subcomplex assembly factor 7